MKDKKKKFRIGDKITTSRDGNYPLTIRRVTDIRKDSEYESGYAICVDGGEPCSKCGKCPTSGLDWIDSGWLDKVEKK